MTARRGGRAGAATHVLETAPVDRPAARWSIRARGLSAADVEAELTMPTAPLPPLSLWRVRAVGAETGESWFVGLGGRAVRLPGPEAVALRADEYAAEIAGAAGDWRRAWWGGGTAPWLLDLAEGAGLDAWELARAACAVVDPVLSRIEDPDQGRPGEVRPAAALDAADAYLDRRITVEALLAAADAADAASLGASLVDYLAGAASLAARAALGDPPGAAGRAARFVVDAACRFRVVGYESWREAALRGTIGRSHGMVVRDRIPLVNVLLALAEGGR